MANDQQKQDPAAGSPTTTAGADKPGDSDKLMNKKPEDLTAEELRLMADTMPGEGPGDD
jgi:hypothetical protein